MVKSCVQPSESKGALAATITAVPDSSRSSSGPFSSGGSSPRGEDAVAIQIGLRRALTLACGMWTSFFIIDVAVVRFMHAGSLRYFAAVRFVVAAVMLAVLFRLYRKMMQSELALRAYDMLAYTAAAIGIALMCVEFRGLASPYIPGFCLVLLGRTVTSQDPWQRGLVMTAVPVASFFAVLFGAALFAPRVA
ncbi:MAG TPA: hypothetical protein VH044_19870, partial [Polyangiaceae bacterium]|nr:hypothetical protein [Polyangiaceae bacterium]